MKRFKFNMVEIALAIAVISIGLSAVLVLFPVGINATRAAMDENCCSDAAECITRYIRGQFLNVWHNNATANAPFEHSFSSLNIPSAYYTEKNGENSVTLTWSTNPFDPTNFPELYRASNTGANGVYKFVRTGAGGEEIFSAVIKVWMPSGDLTTPSSSASSACPIYVPNTTSGKQSLVTGTNSDTTIKLMNGDTPVDFGSIAQSVLVELSWPADLPVDERVNKRVFRVDMYNPYYEIAP